MDLLNFKSSFGSSISNILDKKPGLDIKSIANFNVM